MNSKYLKKKKFITTFFGMKKFIKDEVPTKIIPLKEFNIEIQHLRRPNMLENIEPHTDIVLSSGDIIVILGLQVDLNIFEKYVINGK